MVLSKGGHDYKLAHALVSAGAIDYYRNKYPLSCDCFRVFKSDDEAYEKATLILGTIPEVSYSLVTDAGSKTEIRESEQFISYWRIHSNGIVKVCIYEKENFK